MHNHELLLEEALTYFRNSAVLQRMLQQFVEKYRSLGRTGGAVKLKLHSPGERESLGGLLGTDLGRKKAVTVSSVQLEQALGQSRFGGLSLQELLFAFAGGPILTKLEEKRREEAEKDQFFAELARGCGSKAGAEWLEQIKNRGEGSRGIHLAYRRDRAELERNLGCVLRALRHLPAEDYERLPVFAARITGDPHGFDPGTEKGRLLIEALCFLQGEGAEKRARRPLTAEEISEILAASGILRDDLFSFVTCAGLLACGRNGKNFATWEQAHLENMVLNVPLREVVKIETARPALAPMGAAEVKSVYVVENPAVFSQILDAFDDCPYPPLLCTHGQFRLAALLLLDRLAEGGGRICYSGDFDPEGLQMAQRLLQRYPGAARAWRYRPDDYARTKPSQLLDAARVRKLKQIIHPALAAVRDSIAGSGKAGYQEQIIPDLIEDLKGCFYPPVNG